MPLQHGLFLRQDPQDVFPLRVGLTLSTGEALPCCVERSEKRHNRFHLTMEPGSPLPEAILAAMARDSNSLPVGLIAVCATPGGHEFLLHGQMISFSFTAQNDFPVTVEAGTLEGITIP